MPQVTFQAGQGHPGATRVVATPTTERRAVLGVAAECLLDVATRSGFLIPTRCGGEMRCGACVVQVVGSAAGLSDLEEEERTLLQRLRAGPRARLACQARVCADVVVRVDLPTLQRAT